MSKFVEKVKVVLKSVPAQGAAVVALLTGVSAAVVPELPADLGVKVGAYVAAAVGVVHAVVRVVSKVTPVLFPEDEGLLPAEPFVWDDGGEAA
jgi:hypothetical protein